MSVPSLGPEGRQIYEGYEVLSPQKKNVGNGQTLKREADSVDGADRSASGGFDDGSDIGVEDGAPVATKAVGDLAIDGTGAQGPLGPVVGGGEPYPTSAAPCAFLQTSQFAVSGASAAPFWVRCRSRLMARTRAACSAWRPAPSAI